MIIRKFKESDYKASCKIFALYWTDPEFLEELSGNLQTCIDNSNDNNLGFYVGEKDGEVVGIVGYKKLPEYMRPYSTTDNPVELYVIASKHQKTGIGRELKKYLIEKVGELGFREILLFSPNSHENSWKFHDTFGFVRAGAVTPPEDEIGQIWRKVL